VAGRSGAAPRGPRGSAAGTGGQRRGPRSSARGTAEQRPGNRGAAPGPRSSTRDRGAARGEPRSSAGDHGQGHRRPSQGSERLGSRLRIREQGHARRPGWCGVLAGAPALAALAGLGRSCPPAADLVVLKGRPDGRGCGRDDLVDHAHPVRRVLLSAVALAASVPNVVIAVVRLGRRRAGWRAFTAPGGGGAVGWARCGWGLVSGGGPELPVGGAGESTLRATGGAGHGRGYVSQRFGSRISLVGASTRGLLVTSGTSVQS
jgi:hypothetical protein